MVNSFQLGYLANLGIAAFLIASAALVATRLKLPGSRALALFFVLISGNYALDAISQLLQLGSAGWPARIGYLLALLDPPLLLIFALAQDGAKHSRLTYACAVAPSLWLAGYASWSWVARGAFDEESVAPLYAPMLVSYYLLALALLVLAHHHTRSAGERALRASLVIAFAPIVLPRIPLVAIDLDVVGRAFRGEPWTLLVFDAPLVMLVAAFVALFVWTAPRAAREDARRTALIAAALCGAVALVWALRFAPLFTAPAFALMYSSRWFVFAGAFSLWAGRQELLGIPSTIGMRVRAGFALLLAFLLVVELASLTMSVGAPLPAAIAAATIVGIAVVVVGAALARGASASPDERLRRMRLYRARATLGATPAELDALRRELDLTREQAAREERLIELERAAPVEGLGRPAPGALFAARYEVSEVIGSGSFGLVYAARDLADGRAVVLKELRPGWRGHEEAAARLRREAKAALGVSSPHVVALLAVERSADGDVLVFERIGGQTLRQRLEASGPLTEGDAGRIARDVLAGLAALHDAGVLHRDLKPENIVVRPDGRAVIVDLGSAGALDGSGTRPGGEGPHPGTPPYMSPEQRRGKDLTRASDVYSAAVTLWEALSGTLPPAGRIPPAWREPIERALAEAPSERYASARAFVDALPRAPGALNHKDPFAPR